jgi:CheY-like chemotaxis protein
MIKYINPIVILLMQSSPSLSFLVVDDEQELANLYKEFIQRCGHRAVSFTNPVIALEHYKQCLDKYSIILTDLRMPGMSGIELANKIRELNSKVKIFLNTAFDVDDIRDYKDYQKAKIDKVLQKPIKLATLKKLIEQDLLVKSTQRNQ